MYNEEIIHMNAELVQKSLIQLKKKQSKFKSEKVDWGLTHIGRQLDMKGMLWILQQVNPTKAWMQEVNL